MPARIRFGQRGDDEYREADIIEYQWHSDDDGLVELLNTYLDPRGPSGADPDPDWTMAQLVAERLGGEAFGHEEVGRIAGRVY